MKFLGSTILYFYFISRQWVLFLFDTSSKRLHSKISLKNQCFQSETYNLKYSLSIRHNLYYITSQITSRGINLITVFICAGEILSRNENKLWPGFETEITRRRNWNISRMSGMDYIYVMFQRHYDRIMSW